MLNVDKSQWSPMPDLQVARESHASCTAHNSNVIYVFCGFDADGQCLSSIEKLAAYPANDAAQPSEQW